MNKLLSGKKILITGGSSQLGKAFIQKALAEGAEIFTTYFQHKEDLVPDAGVRMHVYPLDLSNRNALEEFVRQIKAETDSLDILIHNAAAIRDHTLQNLSEEDWDYVLDVNLRAPYYLTKKLLPFFIRKRKGSDTISCRKIFTIASRVGQQGGYGVSNYAAAKAGLIAFTKSLAQEIGRRNVLVNAINPGFMKSKMTSKLPEDVINKNIGESLVQRYSSADEVAEFMIYLCSDKMTQVSGQVLHFESRKTV